MGKDRRSAKAYNGHLKNAHWGNGVEIRSPERCVDRKSGECASNGIITINETLSGAAAEGWIVADIRIAGGIVAIAKRQGAGL